jgi:hypothetical protein
MTDTSLKRPPADFCERPGRRGQPSDTPPVAKRIDFSLRVADEPLEAILRDADGPSSNVGGGSSRG